MNTYVFINKKYFIITDRAIVSWPLVHVARFAKVSFTFTHMANAIIQRKVQV